MKRPTIIIALTAAALLLGTDLSSAATAPQQATGTTKASPATARITLVDINSAKKEELKKLPGVSDADADKIIAGRPYASKANLVTHKILSEEVYMGVKGLVIAKQPFHDGAKNAALYAPKKQ